MFFQPYNFLEFFILYLPTIISTCLYSSILAFGYLIYKKKHHSYALFLIVSAFITITKNIIYLSINYMYLAITLYIELNLSPPVIAVIMTTINTVFFIFDIISAIFLTLALYYIYKTHRTHRIEQNLTKTTLPN
jgi:hypothetical protein